MAQGAAHGAPVAGLPMTDLQQRLGQDRALRHDAVAEFDVALAGHRADDQQAIADRDPRHLRDTIEVDEMVRQNHPHVQHGHQGLAARQYARIGKAREQMDRCGDSQGVMISEGGRLHTSGVLTVALS